ncbi:hypothetical protein XELAEV_18034978mg [Xenopus laevis]|uniref:Uncharacterized protein n=1 Tax=Xenopus laevis TaxID=8355 RepID=A0A974CF44_XENLA|nr:hypothetical protein XELAEV_18034978mg [Xenopus laevis]
MGKWKNVHPPSEMDFLERVRFIRRMKYLTTLRNGIMDSLVLYWCSLGLSPTLIELGTTGISSRRFNWTK